MGNRMNTINSQAMQKRAKQRIPGMTQLLSKRPDQFSFGVWPGYYSKAKGDQVWDLDGNRYIDMSISGIGANVLGYADDDVDAAVCRAIKKGSSSSLNCPEEVELADLLCEIHPWADKVRYARSGGESMAIAVRIARAYTGKDAVAFCGYHGWHDWYLSANLGTENALGEHLLSGLDPCGVPKGLKGTAIPFRYNHIEELKNIITKHGKDLAAIVMEPIRDDEPEEGFFDEVRYLANETKAVFIVDEISAGFRLNSGGAHLVYGIEPDIAVFSKALGNGYPIAAIIGKSRFMDATQKTFISSTMWTERIGPTAALATIKKHQTFEVGKHLMLVGKQVQEGWRRLAEKHGIKIDVGGITPLSHFMFEYSNKLVLKALFIQLMLERGFLASTSFYSMYAHQLSHVKRYLNAVDEVFGIIAKNLKTGDIDRQLKGKPATAGFKRLT
jgi:glutamate-1-semialdehyde 2,1-aminomutase